MPVLAQESESSSKSKKYSVSDSKSKLGISSNPESLQMPKSMLLLPSLLPKLNQRLKLMPIPLPLPKLMLMLPQISCYN